MAPDGPRFAPPSFVKSPADPDGFFQELDGVRVSANGSEWRLKVFGIVDELDRRWVQVELEGHPVIVLTLRLGLSQEPRQAVHQIVRWMVDPSASHSDVLERVA